MPRTSRVAPGGMVFHVLNRGVGRQRLFDKPADYAAFEEVLEETLAKQPIRICSYCLMPNHWHFVLWPENDRDLAAFMQRLSVTHGEWQRGQVHIAMILDLSQHCSARFLRMVDDRLLVAYGHLTRSRNASFFDRAERKRHRRTQVFRPVAAAAEAIAR